MPRRLRVEYEGGVYHVINRGNYRRDVFETAGAAQAFVDVLAEATRRYGWKVHAYVVMRNHYHLAVETPRPNLGDGMHWLQSTLAIRFNRLRNERGHLFQGRYQALLVENREVLARLVNYIHLNPVRAKIVEARQAGDFRWSSLATFIRGKEKRFAGLEAEYWLEHYGYRDDRAGWLGYAEVLRLLAEDEEAQKRQGFQSMSKGWLLGTDAWRKAIAKEHAHRSLTAGVEREQSRQLKEARWTQRLEELLNEQGRGSLEEGRKNQPWKLTIASRLRKEEGASAAWLARALHLGTPATARNYLSQFNAKK